MNYKGDDLDLRTPQSWTVSGSDERFAPGADTPAAMWNRTAIYNGGRTEPLWVDDIALSCINHAYDLAVVHRAGEVELEHLLNAFTLNPAAARILDDHGYSVSTLRKESASIVATVIPVGLTNGKSTPRTSQNVEELLRLAANRAYPRHEPITVETILKAVNEMKQDLSGLDLLRRHAGTRPTQRHQVVSDVGRDMHVTSKPSSGSSTVTDSLQNSRLDALEQLVRNLSRELESERQSYASLVDDIQRGVVATNNRRHTIAPRNEDAEEAMRLVADRLSEIETGIEDRFSDLARGYVELGDRLRDLDQKFDHGASHVGSFPASDALDTKLATLERTFGLILDRLTGLERRLESGVGNASGDLGPVTELIAGLESRTSETVSGTRAVFERMSAIERKLDSLANGPGIDNIGLEQRLGAVASGFNEQSARIESVLSSQLVPLRQSLANVEQRTAQFTGADDGTLLELHDVMLKLNQNQQSLSSTVENLRSDQSGELARVSNHMQNVEIETGNLRNLVETMASNIGVVYAILSKREENKSKVKNWLFGTDDWYSASWDTERWREQVAAAGGFVPMPRRRNRQAAAARQA